MTYSRFPLFVDFGLYRVTQKKRAPKVDNFKSYIFRNYSLSFAHSIVQTVLFPFPEFKNISTYYFHTTWYLPHVPLFEPDIFQQKRVFSTMIFIFLTAFPWSKQIKKLYTYVKLTNKSIETGIAIPKFLCGCMWPHKWQKVVMLGTTKW